MARTSQVHVVTVVPLGAAPDSDETVDITLVLGGGTPALEAGDHLHVILTKEQLDNLSRHIEHAREQLPAASGRQ